MRNKLLNFGIGAALLGTSAIAQAGYPTNVYLNGTPNYNFNDCELVQVYSIYEVLFSCSQKSPPQYLGTTGNLVFNVTDGTYVCIGIETPNGTQTTYYSMMDCSN